MRLIANATLVLSILLLTPHLFGAMGETPDQSIARYGKPEREAVKESGLLYFRKGDLCVIAHFFLGQCDVLSLFSATDDLGLPKSLEPEQIKSLLRSEGGDAGWEPLPGFTINEVWDSKDGKTFAIYDTMRHKLVLMTRDAYRREKEAKRNALRSLPKPLPPSRATTLMPESPSPTPTR